jgi:dedicator of cytokinesis protein 6/7/8
LVSVCEGAADYLTRAHLYEAASEVFKLLVRVHDKNRDHAKLGIAYAAMSELHHKIRDAELTHSRVLGSYYRVAFFGSKFGELDGLEYIYKEPRLTRLGEICDRLTSLFSSKLGPGTAVELYTKSGDVDRSKLDPAKCYIQITSVSPYFEEWELKDRKTDFERNFNISTFIFETPFTKGGKSHATSLSEQFKLRTILSVEASFPYMKKRLLVTSKRTEEVSPIENSLELIKKRNAALREELLHPTAKTLQPVLQGSVRLQVHAGPTEICKTFLADSAKYPARSVQELRRCLQEFLDVCGEALSKNRELITSSQLSFHQELEDGFAAVRAEMEPFLVD